jgi:hypothetical protein
MSFSFLQRTFVYLLSFSSLLCFSQTKFEMQDIFSLQYANEIQLSLALNLEGSRCEKDCLPENGLILSHGFSNTDNLLLIR